MERPPLKPAIVVLHRRTFSGRKTAKVRLFSLERTQLAYIDLASLLREARYASPGDFMLVEQPVGDVADRITILELKSERLPEARRPAAALELQSLREAWMRQCRHDLESLPGFSRLREVNGELWDVEDQLRALERANSFGAAFVSLARRVYVLNDERAVLKRGISEHTGSRLVEQKSYV